MMVIDRSTAPHYTWQSLGHGWRLLDRPDPEQFRVISAPSPHADREELGDAV